MKLATLNDGSRDGRLVVVSKDLTRCAAAQGAPPTLQAAIESWSTARPLLEALYHVLNAEPGAGEPFDPSQALAPLPRAYQWLDASAFLSHGVLMQRALGLESSPQADGTPLMYQGASDDFLGCRQPAIFPRVEDGIDFEGEFGVVLGETAMGVAAEAAEAQILLVVQLNDWSLRGLARQEMASGFGFLQAKPSTAFAPVAVTLDELGSAWREGRVGLNLQVDVNGQRFGAPRGEAMDFSFGQLIAHAARTRRLRAGTILGSGTVSNSDADSVGSACISERRALDAIAGRPATSFLQAGDVVRMEARLPDGPVFGVIEQTVMVEG